MANDDLAVTRSILRIIKRWSQSELAEAAGVTNSAISDYERWKVDPQTQTLQKRATPKHAERSRPLWKVCQMPELSPEDEIPS